MVFPSSSTVEPAHPDLPPNCREEYDEAASVFSRSPRAAAALLRLAVEHLLPEIGGDENKTINENIKTLVAAGLPPKIQQALDICRVIGNHLVHPGVLDPEDTPELAASLFKVINIIVEDMITKPREVDELFNSLPPRDLETIAKRDAPKAK